jgi:hypothetical protein
VSFEGSKSSKLMSVRTRAYRGKLKEWGYLRHKPRKATKDRSVGIREAGDDDESDDAVEVLVDVDVDDSYQRKNDLDVDTNIEPSLLQEAEK